MKVTIIGPLFDASGYAYHTRSIAMELERLGVMVSVKPTPWGAAQIDLSPEEKKHLAEMLKRPDPGGDLLYITVANTFQKHPHRRSIGWTMLETDRIPDLWVRLCNAMDEVWVPTRFNYHTFANSGVETHKLHVVPLGTYPQRFNPNTAPIPIPGRRGFVFLSNFEWIPRKGHDILLRAYFHEFSGREDVSLLLKTYDNSNYDPTGSVFKNAIKQLISEVGNPEPPHVIVLSRVIRPEQIPSLYAAADCYVLPTRGEGWNHPALEALAMGIPVITTAWSGHLDFLSDDNCYPIPIKGLEPVPMFGIPNDYIYGGSNWAVPSLEDTRRLLRYVFEHREEARAKARRGREDLIHRLTWENSARVVMQRLFGRG